jgi:hypothetical protein
LTVNLRHPLRGLVLAGCLAALLGLFAVGQAQAATTAYPAGVSTFSGSAESWKATEAGCNVPALCTASGGYDAAVGNPAGSLAATTNITVNAASLFKSTVTLVSPNFTVGSEGPAKVHVDRQFSQGNLVELNPSLIYSVRLIDRTAGTESTPIKETITATSPFTGVDHASSVKPGHTYALAITAETSSSTAGSSFASGSTSAHFDNVSLSVQSAGDEGATGSGNGSMTNSELRALITSSLIGPAVLKGNRVSVKAKCPKKIGIACSISVQGLLTKKKPATSTRTAKVGKGKTKKYALQVKPKARGKVKKAKTLLFKETVRAGKAKATVYKRLKLIHR